MVLSFDKTNFINTLRWWFIIVSFNYYPDFDHHINLPHVCTHLYWSFNPINSTLSVKFQTSSAAAVAPPPTGGNGSSWVAWSINPIISTGSCSIGTQLNQVVVFSVDAQRSLMVERYNLSESGTIWGDIVGFSSSFDFGLMKFEAQIALPENSESITQLVMIGHNGDGGKPNLQDADLKLFEVLNLTKAKESTLLRFVDGLSRALSFEKGCTRERNTILDEYLTLNNFEVACNYGVLLMLMSLVLKEDTYWKLFGVVVVFISLNIMYISLTIKVNGVLKTSGLDSFSALWYASVAAIVLPTQVYFVVMHNRRANSLASYRESIRLLEETRYSLIKHYKTSRVSSRISKWAGEEVC